MAAQAWKIYNKAKKKLGNQTISLSAQTWRIALFQSASDFSDLTTSLLTSISGEVASANNYVQSGKSLAGEVWVTGASAKQYKFDADDIIFTASGGNIANIKAAVIFASGATPHVLCFASLTSTQFTLADGNTLTIQMNASGIFTMV